MTVMSCIVLAGITTFFVRRLGAFLLSYSKRPHVYQWENSHDRRAGTNGIAENYSRFFWGFFGPGFFLMARQY